MATIPMGNLGMSVAAPAPALRAPETSGIGAAISRAGSVALQGQAEDAAQAADLAAKRRRTAAALTLAETDNAVRDIHDRIGKAVLDGSISADTAGHEFKTSTDKVIQNSLKSWDPDQQQAMQAHLTGTLGTLNRSLGTLVENRKQTETASFIGQYGEQQSRVAMREGPGKAIERYTAMVQFSGGAAGWNPEKQTEQVQRFKEKVTYDFFDAAGNAALARSDVSALQGLRGKVNGPEGEAIDPARRTQLAHQLLGYEHQIRQQQKHEAEKREAKAERAIGKATQIIESGIPLSAEAWNNLRATVQGTSVSANYNDLVRAESETQRVLRMPIDQQEQYVQRRETELMQNGGTTMADLSNVKRVKAAVESNRKSLESEPLIAAQRLFNRQVVPINFMDLLQEDGPARIAAVFNDRTATLGAMRNQFGNRVGAKPLLPQETQELVRVIDSVGPSKAADVFGALRAAIDNDEVYQAAMRQIAPDSPVRAHAGMLVALDSTITTSRNLIASNTVTNTRRIAETMLAGEQIVNRSRADKASDGSGKSLFVPGRQEFADSFISAAGDLYRGRPAVQEADLQAAFSYYVGRAAQTGRLARDGKDIDSALVKEAMSATLGDVVNLNSNGHVKAPIGMPADLFTKKAREAFAETVQQQGLPATVASRFDDYGLLNYRRDGQYMLTLGGVPVVSPKNGAPVIIDLTPDPGGLTRYRRAQIPRN